jgi:RNA-directed DNA polymerase
MLEKAVESTRRGPYAQIEYARYADDIVILIDSDPRNEWLLRAVQKRLRQELDKLHVEITEEKSRVVDLMRGESFAFLGFEYRLLAGVSGKRRVQVTPKLKKRAALFAQLREVLRRNVSQPVQGVIAEINPILRGWVNYFRIGNSSRCFGMVRDWVGKKIRRHLMRSRQRDGMGWKRWSRQWIYSSLGLFNDYRLRRPALRKAMPAS